MNNSDYLLSKDIVTLKTVIFAYFFMLLSNVNAQTRFTRSTFNSAYSPISIGTGATSSTATGDNVNQTGIPIGFDFGYADSTFTTVGLSTNGVIWFDAIAPSATAGNVNLVTTSSPNQCLAPWFNNLIDDASSDILYQTQGATGSRTFTAIWIHGLSAGWKLGDWDGVNIRVDSVPSWLYRITSHPDS